MKKILLLLLTSFTIQSSYCRELFWCFYTQTGSMIAVKADAMPYFTTKGENGDLTNNLYVITDDDTFSCSFEKISYVKLVDIDLSLRNSMQSKAFKNYSSIIRLEESQSQDFSIYTIDGKKVTNDKLVPNTMYIQNGKKFIFK